jgi:hypothetical protein
LQIGSPDLESARIAKWWGTHLFACDNAFGRQVPPPSSQTARPRIARRSPQCDQTPTDTTRVADRAGF